MSAVSAKPLSPKGLRKFISSLPADRRRESIERQLRLLPRWIMEETARTDGLYNPKVVKNLEKMYDVYKVLWTEYLIENHVNKETV